MRDQLMGSFNCCLFDIESVLNGGFDMANIHYSEPNSVLSAMQVIGDITLVTTAQQFGGFTISELDRVLVKYCKKTLERAREEYDQLVGDFNPKKREEFANKRLVRELEQGFQGLELKLNTVKIKNGAVIKRVERSDQSVYN